MKNQGISILSIALFALFLSYIADSNFNFFISRNKALYASIFFSSITNIGIVMLVMIFIPSIIVINVRKSRKIIYMLLFAFILSVLLSLLFKFLFIRQRPSLIIYPLISILDYSFPSMHSMIVFSLLPILLRHLELKFLWISLAVLIAFSRIYLGFHYLSDVVFGMLVGLLMGYTLLYFFSRNGQYKKI